MQFRSSLTFLYYCVSSRYRSDGTKKDPIKISSMVSGILILPLSDANANSHACDSSLGVAFFENLKR